MDDRSKRERARCELKERMERVSSEIWDMQIMTWGGVAMARSALIDIWGHFERKNLNSFGKLWQTSQGNDTVRRQI